MTARQIEFDFRVISPVYISDLNLRAGIRILHPIVLRAPPKGNGSPSRLELLGEATPMGPREHPIIQLQNQAKGIRPRIKRNARRPRARTCLLKDCGRVFRPDHPQARYCSEHCRNEAGKWREWKARRKYRKTDHGKQVRRVQSRRYRVRQREQKKQKANALSGARVITRNLFFVLMLMVQSPGLNCFRSAFWKKHVKFPVLGIYLDSLLL